MLIEAVRARSPGRNIILLDDAGQAARTVLGLQVTGTREWLTSNMSLASVALGIGDNRARTELIGWLRSHDRALETVIHPSAIIGNTAEIGEGAFLAAGSIVIADVSIGIGAIINTGASVDHDCVIGDVAHIGPGVRLCGNVRVGPRSLVGVGTAVRPGISIGADVIIGAGSAVIVDLPDGGIYAGCPARPIDHR